MSILKEIKTYCKEILTGKILACQKHKWACQRFLDDLKRSDSDDFPYKFDEKKASHFFMLMEICEHTKGPLAGTLKKAEPIEKFIFGQIYGWIHKKTGHRRFRYAYYQVARKNAKSQDLAIVGIYEMSLMGESCAEVLVAATKRDQTKYVWEEADIIIRRSDRLKEKFKTTYGAIRHLRSDSIFSRMSEEDRKKGDGSHPQCGIIDEYHAHETDEYYNVLSSGMKMRTQPLLIIITTAGFDLNNPCYKDEYDYISNILNPDNPIENDRYFALVCELDKNETGMPVEIAGRKIDAGELIDDIEDENNWIKSNPIVAQTEVGRESIRAELKIAVDKPEKMRDYLTKTMNHWINQRESGYMPLNKWANCYNKNPVDYHKKDVICGFDLSSTIDLTSIGFEFPLPNDYYAVLSHSFLPEDKLSEKVNIDKVPYDRWLKEGWVTVTPGAEVDYHFVLQYVLKKYDEYGWARGEACFDKNLATWLYQELFDERFTPIDIPQTFTGLSTATKDFRAKTYQKKIIHDGNPVLAWAIGNAVTRVGPSENLLLDKGKSKERIDPLAALINCHVRAMVCESEGSGRVVFI